MRKELLYSLSSPYREEMKVWGYHFGKEEKSACIVGATRGNEIQQLYVCSQLIRKLTELEERGAIVGDNGILVVPSVNYYAMNIGKRFLGDGQYGYQPDVSGLQRGGDDPADCGRAV